MPSIKFGDVIEALPDTTCALFARGTLGTVAETPDSSGRGLVRWHHGERILMGFYEKDVKLHGG